MALIRWQPFQEVATLRRQMDEMFDELMGSDRQSSAWQPALELQDTDENIILRAELPGVDKNNINIQVTKEAVAISGEHRSARKTEDKGFFRSEFRYGNFQRIVPLPVQVENDKAKADFSNGILTLTLPKVHEARRTVVKLNLADGSATPQMNSQAHTDALQAANN
jgi:HSP20 family protein